MDSLLLLDATKGKDGVTKFVMQAAADAGFGAADAGIDFPALTRNVKSLISMADQQTAFNFADGGEVDTEGAISLQAPQEQGASAGLDSGDYVITAEAMRFYGSKFFNDLIEKAEAAGG
jgi:hypothetical protein